MLSSAVELRHLQHAETHHALVRGRVNGAHRRYKYRRQKIAPAPLPAVALPDTAGRSDSHLKQTWGRRFAEKHHKQALEVDKLSDRLQSKILDLDVESDEGAARIRSNAAASSSNTGAYVARSRNGSQRHAVLSVPPSPEVLVALIRRANAKRALMQELDIQSPSAVASRLLLLSSQLDLPVSQLLAMTRDCGRLLAKRPEELQAGMAALADCMEALIRAAGGGGGSGSSSSSSSSSNAGSSSSGGGSGGRERRGSSGGGSSKAARAGQVDEQRSGAWPGAEAVRVEAEARARAMVATAPRLLLMAPERLRRSGLELGAVCKARGMQVLPMLSLRPDLLQQSASSLAAKMDVLPAALGLPPRRMREVLAKCPDLLRRSPHQLTRRYRLLHGLFRVPAAFLTELVLQEPRVLCFGADTLRAKFEGLAGRYGRFQDDVTDMILVDPSVLIKASAAPPVPAAAQNSAFARRLFNDQQSAAAASPAASLTSNVSGSYSSMDDGDRKDEDRSTNGRPVAATAAERRDEPVPVLDQILQLSAASGMPVDAVLQLVVQDERVCGYSRQQVDERLSTLGSVLGLVGSDGGGGGGGGDDALASVRATMAEHPGLLLLDSDQLLARCEAVARLLQLSPSGGVTAGAAVAASGAAAKTGAMAPSTGPRPSGAAAVLRRHPELLLQEAQELHARVADLSALLLGGGNVGGTGAPAAVPAAAAVPPRLLSLIVVQPGLLTAPPTDAAEKLLVMQSLFEIPRALVLELVFKEPALLAVSIGDLEVKFRALAASFGAFSSDAIDVVLADPSLILRADADDSAPRGGGDLGRFDDGVGRGEQSSRALPKSRSAAGGTAAARWPGSKPGSRSGSPVADAAGRSGRRGAPRGQAQTQAQQHRQPRQGQQQDGPQEGRQEGRLEGQQGGNQRRRQAGSEAAVGEANGWGRGGGGGDGSRVGTSEAAYDDSRPGWVSERLGGVSAGGGGSSGSGGGERGAQPGFSPRGGERGGGREGGIEGRGPGGSSGGGGGGKGDMGLLGMMSAADFDKLGSEGLPPPPPPSARRRRRQQQQE